MDLHVNDGRRDSIELNRPRIESLDVSDSDSITDDDYSFTDEHDVQLHPLGSSAIEQLPGVQQLPVQRPVPQNDYLRTQHFSNLKGNLEENLKNHKNLNMKPYESTTLKAIGVGIREFGSGALNLLGGTILTLSLFGAPWGLYMMSDGASKAWGSVDAGKKFIERADKNLLSKEQLQLVAQRQAILNKALAGDSPLLLDDNFRAFLDDNWTNTNADLSTYDQNIDIDRLGELITVYEKEKTLKESKEFGFTEAETNLMDQLGVSSNIKAITEREINQGKLDRAERKIESYEKKQQALVNELRELGVEVDNEGKVRTPTIEDAKRAQEGKTTALETDKPTKLADIEAKLKANAEKLFNLEHDINDEVAARDNLEDIWFKDTRDAINKKLFPADQERQKIIERKDKIISDLETEKKNALVEKKDLQAQKVKISEEIEKSNHLISQKINKLEQLNQNIIVQRAAISELEFKLFNEPEDKTTIKSTIENLKIANTEAQAKIDVLKDKPWGNKTIEKHKTDKGYAAYQDILMELDSDNRSHTTNIQKRENLNAGYQRELDSIQINADDDVMTRQEKLDNIGIKKSQITHNNLKITAHKSNLEANTKKMELVNEILNQELEIASNNEKISALTPLLAKEQEIRLRLNPHAEKIEALTTEIETLEKDIGPLKSGVDEAETALNDQRLNVHTAKGKIAELKSLNINLAKNMAVNETEHDANVKRITDLEKQVQIIEVNDKTIGEKQQAITSKQKEIDRLYDKLTPSENEIKAELQAIKKKALSGPQPLNGPDLRLGSATLQKWQNKEIEPNQQKIDFDYKDAKGNIYMFGTYNARPSHGSAPPGKYLDMNDPDLVNMGRVDKNNFLSNSYQQELTIDGKTYPSATHYLLQAKIDKMREEVKNLPGVDKAGLEKNFKRLEEAAKLPTAYQANFFFERQLQFFPVPKEAANVNMDYELKKALFFKFVGPDGQPNEEGKKLIATGDSMLYAGYEMGDSSFGMTIADRDRSKHIFQMEGQNKVGVSLMELRDILRKKERRENERGLANEPVNAQRNGPIIEDLPEDDFDRINDYPDLRFYENVVSRDAVDAFGFRIESGVHEDLFKLTDKEIYKIPANSRSDELKLIAGIRTTEITTKSPWKTQLSSTGQKSVEFDGLWENNKPSRGILTYEDGSMYVGKLIDGKPGGVGTDGRFIGSEEI